MSRVGGRKGKMQIYIYSGFGRGGIQIAIHIRELPRVDFALQQLFTLMIVHKHVTR